MTPITFLLKTSAVCCMGLLGSAREGDWAEPTRDANGLSGTTRACRHQLPVGYPLNSTNIEWRGVSPVFSKECVHQSRLSAKKAPVGDEHPIGSTSDEAARTPWPRHERRRLLLRGAR